MKEEVVSNSENINPLYLAHSRLRRRRFDDTIKICSDVLQKNPLDQQAWFLKVRATTLKNWVDDTELEEEGAGDILLEDNAMQAAPRPGTSLSRPLTQASTSAALRPLTQSGRPTTGFLRPGTSSRPLTGEPRVGTAQRKGTAHQQRVSTALRGNKPGTARPTTTSGRFVRLGTASLASQPGGPFIDIEKLNVEKQVQEDAQLCIEPCIKAFVPRTSFTTPIVICCEVCQFRVSLVTAIAPVRSGQHLQKHTNGTDWWWYLRLGMCFYQLSLYKEAITQHEKSLAICSMDETSLHLNKCYLRLDQPLVAAQMFKQMSTHNPDNPLYLLGEARIHDALNDLESSLALYKRVLHLEACNVEAIACMAAQHFYSDQPEVALRFYRRLLMLGVANAEIWNNMGLCCFYASQIDITLRCFENALLVADDLVQADVWYNVSHVAMGLGDRNLAYQALKVAVSLNGDHAEARNNLGVLEFQKGSADSALAEYRAARECGPALYEPRYNGALTAFKAGELETAHQHVNEALERFPEHSSSQELLRLVQGLFAL